MTDVLARIVADKRDELVRRKAARPLALLEAEAARASAPRGFLAALEARAAASGYGLICELKKASPSKGLIREDFSPPELARDYRSGGATCLSVLTDTPYFQGEDSYLVAARAAVPIPVLRKDFCVDPYQVVESRGLGADCILLIMACLEDGVAAELLAAATALGMDALVEVHDRAELERALRLEGRLIGVNNRNLKTLQVDLETFIELAPDVPADRFLVAESGVSSPEAIRRLHGAGARAFLIGEALMREADVATATRRLAEVEVAAPAGALS